MRRSGVFIRLRYDSYDRFFCAMEDGDGMIRPGTGKNTPRKPADALAYALENADKTDAIFIGGSNYLVGEILKYWNSSNPEIQKSSNPVIQ